MRRLLDNLYLKKIRVPQLCISRYVFFFNSDSKIYSFKCYSAHRQNKKKRTDLKTITVLILILLMNISTFIQILFKYFFKLAYSILKI